MRLSRLIIPMILLLASLVHAEDSQPPAILSIIPSQGASGNLVVVSGSGFTPESRLYLGIEEMPLKSVTSSQIKFEIPDLPVGNYALYVRQEDGSSSRAYSFSVISLKPVLTGIEPESVSFCSQAEDRVIKVKGKNFLEGSKVLFDGAIIRGTRISAEEFSFSAPQVPGGLHQVQIRNGEDAVSSAAGLLITSRPEIRSVTPGDSFVNYYELVIEGENFQQGSTLYVDGRKVSGQPLPGERDRVVFGGCRKIVYQRNPYDPTSKSFQLLVINPNGEESSRFSVTAP